MDMISTLRADFKTEKVREATANREKLIQLAANDRIVKPLENVKKDIAQLSEKYVKFKQVSL